MECLVGKVFARLPWASARGRGIASTRVEQPLCEGALALEGTADHHTRVVLLIAKIPLVVRKGLIRSVHGTGAATERLASGDVPVE